MTTSSSALHCVTCNQPLPEGREPAYFGQTSIHYTPEMEVERAAEDTHKFLSYAGIVTEAAWDLVQVADANPPELCEPESYLDTAWSLCVILRDLVDEAERRAATFTRLVHEKRTAEEARTTAPACRKEGD